MKAIVRKIARVILLVIVAAIMGLFAKELLFPKTRDSETPVDTERYVVPIKKSILKDAFKEIGTVSSSSDGMKVVLPNSAKDKIAADQISRDNKKYGATVTADDKNADQLVFTMSYGPGSTILVPVPTFVALVDRGLLKASHR